MAQAVIEQCEIVVFGWALVGEGVIMKLRKVVLGAAAAFALGAVATSASAGGSLKDDRPFSWTGFYVGAHVGAGWSEVDWTFDGFPASNHNGDGMFAGGQVGYNWQFGSVVVGVEADGSVASISGSANCPNPDFKCGTDAQWLASVRGRIGVTAFGPKSLLYATGGWGWAGIHNTAIPFVGGIDTNETYSGFVGGGGVEFATSSNWSYKLEYIGYFLDDKRSTTQLVPIIVEPTIHTVKFGVNYRF